MKKFIFSIVVLLFSMTGFTRQTPSLSQQEKDGILYMREEEKLARDVYDSLFIKWGGRPFVNIRQSEQYHMDRMKTLITTYGLEDPVVKTNDRHGIFWNASLQTFYNELVRTGGSSFTEALKTGAQIEEQNIADLEKRMKQTQKQDIIAVYDYLKMASGNHLRAFVRRLNMQGIPYEPVILSKADFDKIIGGA
ncbi:MAG TPA: hypothetical protein DIC22_02905 [Chitinophagaceae bacterium]|nr:hypothetical protein [Chitinophagaceae bacterium]